MTVAPGLGWGRVERAAALRGTLRLPADKSVAHRALIVGAMAEGASTVSLRRPGDDVRSTLEAVRYVGAVRQISEDVDGTVQVDLVGGGTGGRARLPGRGGETLDCGNSGTTMRLLAGALAGRPCSVTLIGDASLSRRPMERIAAPLRAMGATIVTTDGHAPLVVSGTDALIATHHRLPVASAQVLGSIALAALAARGTTRVEVPGPTRDHTERMLEWLGVPIARDGQRTTIDGPAGFRARDVRVPGDISSAAAWLVAGALHRDASLSLEGVGLNPTRLGVLDVLDEMGATVSIVPADTDHGSPEPVGALAVQGGRALRPVSIGGARVADLIDELPLLAVAMAAIDGSSEVRDAAELRVKESDRISLVVSNLAAIGAQVEELPDGWRVRRGDPRDARIVTAGDHRIAMAFAVAALVGVAGTVEVDDPGCAAVSYPGFWDDLAELAR